MKILALETGGTASPTEAVIVALELSEDDAEVVAIQNIAQQRALAGQLIGTIDEVIADAEWEDISAVDGLCIGAGPGSWTSLRVGFSTFKTLSQTLGIPCVSVPSFDALASGVLRARAEILEESSKGGKDYIFDRQIALALSPCRPGELYGKLFEIGEDYVVAAQAEWIADVKTHLDAAYSQALASGIDAPLLLCGSALEEAQAFLEARGEVEDFQTIGCSAAIVAVEIGLAGAYRISAGEVPPLEDLTPLYLAPSNAERNRAAKNGL